jgi:hypothetical protein
VKVITMNRLLAFLVALLLVAPLAAKEGSLPSRAPLAPPTVNTINGNPLRINVGSDNSYQIFNSDVGSSGQFYPSSSTSVADSGWMVKIGNTLYAPNFSEHGGTATGSLGATVDFTEISMSAVTGAGTDASPFTVTVTVGLGASGVTATKVVSYVNGSGYYSQRLRLVNTGSNAVDAKVFLGSDIYLANSDSGVPYREPTSGSPGGRTCPGVTPPYTILHIPLTPAARYTAAGYDSVWQQIGSGLLNNAVSTGCIDNGAALQWNYALPPGGSATVLAATSFGAIPPITQFNITDVNPSFGQVGTIVNVDIAGYGFVPGTTFTFGAGITVSNLIIRNVNTASATLTIAASAQFGYRDVVATQAPGGLTATLIDGFRVTDVPVWNYSIFASTNVNPAAVACVRAQFPGNPATNGDGWAPDEGTWYLPDIQNPPLQFVPTGLARAILDCYLNDFVWDDAGALYPQYCWDEPAPRYLGDYPWQRVANLRLYNATYNQSTFSYTCPGPIPGATVYEENVIMIRQEFYPTPLGRSGFEQ